MPSAIADITPGWLKPENASVLDGTLKSLIRKLVNANPLPDTLEPYLPNPNPFNVLRDPTSQLLSPMTATVPNVGKLGDLVREAAKRQPGTLGDVVRKLTGGFYSRVDEAAKMVPEKGIKAESLLNTLKKSAGGVSQEELDLRGLAEFAASRRGQTVTPAELAAHLKANPAPFPTVKTLGGPSSEDVLRQHGLRSSGIDYDTDLYRISDGPDAIPLTLDELKQFPQEVMDAFEGVSTGETRTTAPKFSQYQVPGGKNYRETLLTLPDNPAQQAINIEAALAKAKDYDDVPAVTLLRRLQANESGGGIINRLNNARQPGGRYRLPEGDAGQFMPFEAVYRTRQLLGGIDEMRASEGFRSSHFDEPNILAHTRSNERTSPTGERGTFLEEVQSDWHQQGKQKGYATAGARTPQSELGDVNRRLEAIQDRFNEMPESFAEREALHNEQRALVNRHAELTAAEARRHTSGSVPDAPFKENWPDLSLKQALIDEANRAPNDPSFLGFTGGKTQASRYDLSKQVSEIEVRPVRMDGDRPGVTSGWRVTAKDLSGRNNVITEDISTLDKLPDYIGKDAARTAQQQIESGGTAKLTGLDLQVGGEGMHEFYDKLLPKRLEKIVKPFGGTVESGAISHRQAVPSRPDDLEYMRGFANSGGLTTQQTPMWLSRLTPEMKARILKEGLPLMGLSAATLGELLRAAGHPNREQP